MPAHVRVPCKHPGCAALIPYGSKYCEAHKKLHPEATRSASSRGYGAAWQRESRRFLSMPEHRLCEECLKEGRYVKATVVDHIVPHVPHRGDPALFWDRSNWRGLCKSCHDKKTGREDSHPTYHY